MTYFFGWIEGPDKHLVARHFLHGHARSRMPFKVRLRPLPVFTHWRLAKVGQQVSRWLQYFIVWIVLFLSKSRDGRNRHLALCLDLSRIHVLNSFELKSQTDFSYGVLADSLVLRGALLVRDSEMLGCNNYFLLPLLMLESLNGFLFFDHVVSSSKHSLEGLSSAESFNSLNFGAEVRSAGIQAVALLEHL